MRTSGETCVFTKDKRNKLKKTQILHDIGAANNTLPRTSCRARQSDKHDAIYIFFYLHYAEIIARAESTDLQPRAMNRPRDLSASFYDAHAYY